MAGDLDYVDHVARESARFAAVLGGTPADTRVPSCPEWSADDLLWHLAGVQWFWATIVREERLVPPPAEARPVRPDGRAGLLAFHERASADLVSALAAAGPEDPVWTWSPDRTVGFVRRRQAHEALIHRVDAELTAGRDGPMDPQLSADGVDEALRVMYGGVPAWATVSPDGPGAVRLRASDTGHAWSVRTGWCAGTDPDDGTTVGEPCLLVASAAPDGGAPASVTGPAADLDRWLWRRPTVGALERSGDPGTLDRLDAVIRPGID